MLFLKNIFQFFIVLLKTDLCGRCLFAFRYNVFFNLILDLTPDLGVK